MKNKFTRKDLKKVSFDFTGLKNDKIKRISKNILIAIGYLLAGITTLFVLYIFYLMSWACM